MRKLSFQNLGLLLLAGFIALYSMSCSVSSTSMQVLVPADIYVPQEIQKVVVVNRSLPEKKKTVVNVLEGFITGESILADREGSMNCVRGLSNHLNANPRFEAILLESLDLRGTGTRQFPTPLEWSRVSKICKRHDVDALIALETFDSNIGIRESTKKRKRKEDGKEVEYLEYYADLRINVTAGWRIYDAKNQRIIDQNTFTDEKGWTGRGSSSSEARRRLPSKRSAINDAGLFSGTQYGVRISPSWMNATRQYYVKGHDKLEESKRYVRSQDWKGAMDIWKPLTNNSDPKIAGRACFNMALACEMEGKLDIALTWAEKAYKQYNVKKAQSYINILNKRIMDQQRLKEQMEGR